MSEILTDQDDRNHWGCYSGGQFTPREWNSYSQSHQLMRAICDDAVSCELYVEYVQDGDPAIYSMLHDRLLDVAGLEIASILTDKKRKEEKEKYEGSYPWVHRKAHVEERLLYNWGYDFFHTINYHRLRRRVESVQQGEEVGR